MLNLSAHTSIIITSFILAPDNIDSIENCVEDVGDKVDYDAAL